MLCGYVIYADGVETDPQKTCKIKHWPQPLNVSEIRYFLGFAGYYWMFLKDFSK